MHVDLRIYDGSLYRILYKRTYGDGRKPSKLICNFPVIADPEVHVAFN